MYDALAGSQNLESSYYLTRSKTLGAFPMLKPEGLKASIVYYDGTYETPRPFAALIIPLTGQHNDSR